ncbi:MAG: cytochrome oxidase small assembly protein [Burkholderiaceae bacterium]|nr:cytochrome oxidase small assembly protein [Burkholderiaceae bacterium]
MAQDALSGDEKRQNRRTALVLLSIALVFFAGVIAKYWLLA